MTEVAPNHYISPVYHENLQSTFDHIYQLLDIESIEAFQEAKEILLALHYADLTTLLENASYDAKSKILELLENNFKEEALVGLSCVAKENLAEILGIKKFAHFINLLGTEDAIEVIGDFQEELKNETLAALSKERQKDILEGFTYPDNTSGRVMEKNFITLQEHWTIGQATDAIRSSEFDNAFYAAIVVNSKNKPIGQILLSSLLKHKKTSVVQDVMDKDLKIADTHTPLDQLSYIFKQYALTVVPVTNKVGKLVGTISIDNMLYIIEQQTEDELMHLGGVSNHDIFHNFFSTAKHRFLWLFFNFITACITSIMIDQFRGTIGKFVTLAAIMPIVASLAGNAGTQTMTVTVRALHNKDLNHSNSMRAIAKEFVVSGFNGVILATIGSCLILIVFSDITLSIIFAAAVIISFLFAGAFGAFIPIFLDKIKIDPAAASGVLLTAITDTLGFCSFLTLAYFFLV